MAPPSTLSPQDALGLRAALAAARKSYAEGGVPIGASLVLPHPADAPGGRGASPRAHLWNALVPFELEVLHAKTRYWAGDHMGYLDALAALLHRCKRKARAAKTDAATAAMWTERGARVCLIIASQLIEMKVRVFC